MLCGVVSKSINCTFLPSITITSLSTLSAVTAIVVELSVDVNVIVSPAVNVPPAMPPKRTRVLPSLYFPAVPSNAYKPLLAKYVNELSHSILTPFVAIKVSTPGVINVTA